MLVSAIEQTGMKEVVKTIDNIVDQNKKNGIFDKRRFQQLEYWIEEEVRNIITSNLTKEILKSGNISQYSKKVLKNEISMYDVVEKITEDLKNK